MKKLLTLLAVICSLTAFAQSAEEHLKNGLSKHNSLDFKGAISDYDKAIKKDKKNVEAYFNRGTCALALKDYKPAMADFNKAILLDPKFTKAYYSRATVYASMGKYVEALPDLDKTIELNPSFPNALTLRGQIRAQAGNKKGACEDFQKAKEFGDKDASKYLSQFCGNEQQSGESLMIYWPEDENWKIGHSQEDKNMAMLELIHADESIEKWTELGTMMSIKGAKGVPMDEAMKLMYDQSLLNAPKAKLTFIEKDESAEYPWIIFMIEAPSFKNDKTPESQLWYIVQGKEALYTNFRAIKKAEIPADLKEKWVKFFKTSKVVNK